MEQQSKLLDLSPLIQLSRKHTLRGKHNRYTVSFEVLLELAHVSLLMEPRHYQAARRAGNTGYFQRESDTSVNVEMETVNATDETCYLHGLLHEISPHPQWIWVVFTFLLSCIFLVGAAGNLLTCIVIYCDRKMHTATNYYLFNLAVSDLIVSVGLVLDWNAFSDYPIKFGGYEDSACRVHFILVVALWNNGILIMTALSIERYIAIWHPLLLNKRPVWRRVMKIIFVIWTVAILVALPEMWTVRLMKTRTYVLCFIVPTPFARLLNSVLGLVTFVIPLVIMTFVYAMVAFKVNVTQKGCVNAKIFNNRNSSRKVNKLIIALTLSFMLCWMPFFILRVLVVVTDWCANAWLLKYWDVLLMVCSVNSWFSIVLNPMLFSLMSTKFRQALKGLWKSKVKRQQFTCTHVTAAL